MNPNRFFMPGYIGGTNNLLNTPPITRMFNSVLPPIGKMSNINNTTRGLGILSKLTGGIRSVNWSGLLNNANKTLNIMNQAIPLVRQAGPMVSNMKNMMKIAKVFGNETNTRRNNNRNVEIPFNIQNNITSKETNRNNNIGFNDSNSENISIYDSDNFKQKKEEHNGNSPNFFV